MMYCSTYSFDMHATCRVQKVGWPPIRSYRKNSLQPKKAEDEAAAGMYVKVSMDGAPYLRKIDLKVYKGYPELLKALENMFKLTIGKTILMNMHVLYVLFIYCVLFIYV